MSKIKRIIEIDDSLYNRIKDRMIILEDIPRLFGAVVESKPYDDSGDLISRGEIRKAIEKLPNVNPSYSHTCDVVERDEVFELIDSAQTVPLPSNQIAWEQGYECGYHQAKENIAKRIKEQYNEHHELIPYWLSIGDVKGGAE